jgi:uncharacterized sulfatase
LLRRKNHVDRDSVFSAIDLVPTLLDLTGTPHAEGVTFDGESLKGTLLGDGGSREAPIFFRRPPDRNAFYGDGDLPDLALRAGRWKLLCEYDGSAPELYDLEADPGETENLADRHGERVRRLSRLLIRWHESMPPDSGATYRVKR